MVGDRREPSVHDRLRRGGTCQKRKSDGITVKDDAISKGAEWLERDLAAEKKLAPDLRAYMVYALALAGPHDTRGTELRAYGKRSALSPYGLALLGLAFEPRRMQRAGELAASTGADGAAEQRGSVVARNAR